MVDDDDNNNDDGPRSSSPMSELKKIYDVDYMEASCNICIYIVLSVYKLLFKNA